MTAAVVAQSHLKGRSVLGAHEVVEDGVEGGGEEVEAAGEVEEVLVDGSECEAVLEVDIAQPLDVKRSPRDEEENHHGNCEN